MEFQQVIERRRMVRNFHDEPLAPGVVDRILRNATRGPSAGFTQGFEFLVLEDAADRARFWDAAWPDRTRAAARREGVTRAPLVVVPCADRDAYLDRYAEPDKGRTDRNPEHWPVPYWLVDTAFASMLVLLTAVDEELGALFFGYPDPGAVKRACGIPERFAPIGAIAIGRPASLEPSPSARRGRRPLSSLVHRGRWEASPTDAS